MPLAGPAPHAFVITPSDTVDLRVPTQFISFGVATGAVTDATIYIDTVGGESNVPIVLPAGYWPLCAKRVYATGTTATNIVGHWGPL